MVNVLISGCCGRMGQAVAQFCLSEEGVSVVAGVDPKPSVPCAFPVYADPFECSGPVDVVIDFSNPAALSSLLSFCLARKVPLVLSTTGLSEEQLKAVDQAAEEIPVFRSANMSLGINVLLNLVRRAASILGSDWDLEIVERHHNKKLDAPSGTALMIADAAKDALPYEPEYVYDRHSVRQERDHREIGISAVRGGGIVGDHEVIFAGPCEVLELRHSAGSREVFAAGAVKAAVFLAKQQAPGLYSMDDLIASF